MVEGARLESVYRGNSIEGSNPSLSASLEASKIKLARPDYFLRNHQTISGLAPDSSSPFLLMFST